MTSTDAPAWVQAIGSVLAIVAAVCIAWWQQRSHEKHRREEKKDTEGELIRQTVLLCRTYGDRAASALEELIRRTAEPYSPLLKAQFAVLVELRHWQIPAGIGAIPDKAVIAHLRIRALVAEAAEIQHHLAGAPDGPTWRSYLGPISEEVARWVSEFDTAVASRS